MGLIPSQVSQAQFDCYGPNGLDDMVWFRNKSGIVSWVDCNGIGQGNLVRLTGAQITAALGLVVQNSLLAIDTNIPESVSNTNSDIAMYQVALYMFSRGDGASGSTLVTTVQWTGVSGIVHQLAVTLLGPSENIQQETFALLCQAGTAISVTTAFGTTSFHYDICAAITLIPV